MKIISKISLSVLATVVLSRFAFAELSMTAGGRPGGARVYSTLPLPKGTFSLGYALEYSKSKDVQFEGNNDLSGDQISLNYAAFSDMQLFLNKRTFLNNNSNFLGALQSVDFSKSEFGTLITLPMASHYFLGIEPEYALFNGNGGAFFQASSFGIRLLNTYSYCRGEQTLRLHLNNQFFLDRSSKLTDSFNYSYFKQNRLYGLSHYNSVNHGAALELEASRITSFVEYTLDEVMLKKIPVFRSPSRITSGIKFSLKQHSPWQITLAAERGFETKKIDFVPLQPTWNVLTSISFMDISTPKIEINETSTTEYPVHRVLPLQILTNEPKDEKQKTEEPKKTDDIQSKAAPLYPIYPIVRGEKTTPKIEVSIVRKKIKKETFKALSPVTMPSKAIEAKRPEKEAPEFRPETQDISPSKNEFSNSSKEDQGKNFLIHFR